MCSCVRDCRCRVIHTEKDTWRERRGGEGRGGPECSIYRIICHAVHISNGHMLYVNFMIYLIMMQLLGILVPLITHKVGMTSIPALV